jgi:hypothetical protein
MRVIYDTNYVSLNSVNFRGVRVALGPGYNRDRGIDRASRNSGVLSPVGVVTVRPASLVISPTLATHGILPPLTARHALALRHVEAVIFTHALRLGVARPAVTVAVVVEQHEASGLHHSHHRCELRTLADAQRNVSCRSSSSSSSSSAGQLRLYARPAAGPQEQRERVSRSRAHRPHSVCTRRTAHHLSIRLSCSSALVISSDMSISHPVRSPRIECGGCMRSLVYQKRH